jgi:hypothetical protein
MSLKVRRPSGIIKSRGEHMFSGTPIRAGGWHGSIREAGSASVPSTKKGSPITAPPSVRDYIPGLMPNQIDLDAKPQPGEYGPSLEAQSRRIFNPSGNYLIPGDQEARRQQWMYNAQQQAIRNGIEMKRAGHDYSVEWRNR